MNLLYQKYETIDVELLRKLVKNVYYGSDGLDGLAIEQQMIEELPLKIRTEIKNKIYKLHY